MLKNIETADRPWLRTLARGAGAVLFSTILGTSGPALAAHGGGGFHAGGFHGGGFRAGGFHGGGFHGGAFHVAGLHGDHFRAGGFHHHAFYGGRYHGGWGYGFYPGLGLGLAFGLSYPWDSYYYPPYDGYYGTETPYAGYYENATPYNGYYGTATPYASSTNWYYCSNPAGYYPYVTQCYGTWQAVPAS